MFKNFFFFSHVSPVQVRASVTPLPAVMEGRVMTTETPSCVAAPQAGEAAPATQVSLITLITLLWLW